MPPAAPGCSGGECSPGRCWPGGLAAFVAGAIVASGDDAHNTATGARVAGPPAPNDLPRGGRTIFPAFRVVAYYGAPQNRELGALGIGTPDQAARRLERAARPYVQRSRPVLPAMELIATIAQAAPGRDGRIACASRRPWSSATSPPPVASTRC